MFVQFCSFVRFYLSLFTLFTICSLLLVFVHFVRLFGCLDIHQASQIAVLETVQPIQAAQPGCAHRWPNLLPAVLPVDELWAGEEAMWLTMDSRTSLDGIYDTLNISEYNLMLEAVEIDGVAKFFNLVGARHITDWYGRSIAKVCVIVMQRVRHITTDPHIRVVKIDKMCKVFEQPSRVYGGIMRIAVVPPMPIRVFLQHELRSKIPRNMMGKSIFDLNSKIYRYLWRQFSEPMRYINADICNAQPSLLFTSPVLTASDRVRIPTIAANYNDRDGMNESILQGLNTKVKPPLTSGHIKTLVIAAMGQASLTKYLKDINRSIGGANNADYDGAVVMYDSLKQESFVLAEIIAGHFPEAAARCRLGSNWVGSLLRRYANVLERRVVDMSTSNLDRTPVSRPVATERILLDTQHDGFGALSRTSFAWPEYQDINLQYSNWTVRMKYKTEGNDFETAVVAIIAALQDLGYLDPLSRTPSMIMSGEHFLMLFRNCINYFNTGATTVRVQSGEISRLLACCLEGTACKTRGEVEIFDNFRLYVAANNDAATDILFRKVQKLLAMLFGKIRLQTWNDHVGSPFFEPIPPCGCDEFIAARKTYCLRNLSQMNRSARDANAKNKLLTRDGHYWDYVLKCWMRNSSSTSTVISERTNKVNKMNKANKQGKK